MFEAERLDMKFYYYIFIFKYIYSRPLIPMSMRVYF